MRVRGCGWIDNHHTVGWVVRCAVVLQEEPRDCKDVPRLNVADRQADCTAGYTSMLYWQWRVGQWVLLCVV